MLTKQAKVILHQRNLRAKINPIDVQVMLFELSNMSTPLMEGVFNLLFIKDSHFTLEAGDFDFPKTRFPPDFSLQFKFKSMNNEDYSSNLRAMVKNYYFRVQILKKNIQQFDPNKFLNGNGRSARRTRSLEPGDG